MTFYFKLKTKINRLRRSKYVKILILILIIVYLISRMKSSGAEEENDILSTSVESTNYNVYLIETNENRKYFSDAQLCSIESLIGHNSPHGAVYVYSLKAVFDRSIRISKQANNINVRNLNLCRLLDSTPLFDWWVDRKVLASPHKFDHFLEAAKYALLWKNGGIYAHFDSLFLNSFRPLVENYQNALGFVNIDHDEPRIVNTFLMFKSQHSFLKSLLTQYTKSYNANEQFNEPRLVLKTIQDYCNRSDVTSLIDDLAMFDKPVRLSDKCADIYMLPMAYFAPLSSKKGSFVNRKKKFPSMKWVNGFRFEDAFSILLNPNHIRSNQIESDLKKNLMLKQLLVGNCPKIYFSKIYDN